MIVDRVLIIDHENGEAGEYTLLAGPNIIVSETNKQGKSSLVKSLYYCLGLDIKAYPDNWDPKKMTIKLDVTIEATGEKLYIIRKSGLFYVPEIVKPLNLNEYTVWLSHRLKADMKLQIKKTTAISSISHPSALIVPFYIDQDESWSKRLFSTSSEMNMYQDTPERIFEYILGITDDDEAKIKEVRSKHKGEKALLSTKRKHINDVYMDYIEDLDPVKLHSSIIDPAVQNTQNIDTFINLMNEANKRYIETRATRIKLQRDLDQKRKSYNEYSSILKMQKSDYKAIKCICKNCKSELTNEQVKTRMDINTNIFELSFLIATTEQEIAGIEKNLKLSLQHELQSNTEYEQLTKQVNETKELKTIAEYIEENSKKQTQEEFAQILQKLDTKIGVHDAEIKELTAEINASFKESRKRVEDIKTSFSEYVNDLSTIMVGSNVSKFEFKKFSVPNSSGVHINQAYLGAYLAYMKLVSKYGRYKLPFCIDSFIKNETDNDNSRGMFKALDRYLMQLDGQSIFTAIQKNVDNYLPNKAKYNVIKLGDKLLSKENYQDSLTEIEPLVVIS